MIDPRAIQYAKRLVLSMSEQLVLEIAQAVEAVHADPIRMVTVTANIRVSFTKSKGAITPEFKVSTSEIDVTGRCLPSLRLDGQLELLDEGETD